MADTSYTHGFEVDVVDGANCIEMPAPVRGEINRLIAVVGSGSATISDLTVYDRQDACDGVIRSFNPDDGTQALNAAAHQVTPTLSPTGGVISEFEHSWAYQNRDEQKIHGRMESRLWAKVNITGSGKLHLAYTILVREPTT